MAWIVSGFKAAVGQVLGMFPTGQADQERQVADNEDAAMRVMQAQAQFRRETHEENVRLGAIVAREEWIQRHYSTVSQINQTSIALDSALPTVIAPLRRLITEYCFSPFTQAPSKCDANRSESNFARTVARVQELTPYGHVGITSVALCSHAAAAARVEDSAKNALQAAGAGAGRVPVPTDGSVTLTSPAWALTRDASTPSLSGDAAPAASAGTKATQSPFPTLSGQVTLTSPVQVAPAIAAAATETDKARLLVPRKGAYDDAFVRAHFEAISRKMGRRMSDANVDKLAVSPTRLAYYQNHAYTVWDMKKMECHTITIDPKMLSFHTTGPLLMRYIVQQGLLIVTPKATFVYDDNTKKLYRAPLHQPPAPIDQTYVQAYVDQPVFDGMALPGQLYLVSHETERHIRQVVWSCYSLPGFRRLRFTMKDDALFLTRQWDFQMGAVANGRGVMLFTNNTHILSWVAVFQATNGTQPEDTTFELVSCWAFKTVFSHCAIDQNTLFLSDATKKIDQTTTFNLALCFDPPKKDPEPKMKE